MAPQCFESGLTPTLRFLQHKGEWPQILSARLFPEPRENIGRSVGCQAWPMELAGLPAAGGFSAGDCSLSHISFAWIRHIWMIIFQFRFQSRPHFKKKTKKENSKHSMSVCGGITTAPAHWKHQSGACQDCCTDPEDTTWRSFQTRTQQLLALCKIKTGLRQALAHDFLDERIQQFLSFWESTH